MTICDDCGCEDVQTKHWVEVNTYIVGDPISEGDTDDNWCPECEAHVEFADVNEKIWKSVEVLSREELISALESIGVACYDNESDHILAQAYYDNVEAGNLEI